MQIKLQNCREIRCTLYSTLVKSIQKYSICFLFPRASIYEINYLLRTKSMEATAVKALGR
jgi:hypothetical protein